ncbi:hypothetical protein BC834DRAFT_896243 [Gloeopeniophorella convolvens]|nr:hypothetical protein BC834DRAFT_896243 [Gloeopeniophorella convolvens]
MSTLTEETVVVGQSPSIILIGGRHHANARIETLPDELLVAIFDFCRCTNQELAGDAGGRLGVFTQQYWFHIAGVCRRWRRALLGSPSRLRLCLRCTDPEATEHVTASFPSLPLLISLKAQNARETLHAKPVLQHVDHALKIELTGKGNYVRQLCDSFTKPAPFLEELSVITWTDGYVSCLPPGFLGGIAPRLRRLRLDGVSIDRSLSFRAATAHLISFTVSLHQQFAPSSLLSILRDLPQLEELIVIPCCEIGIPSGSAALNQTSRPDAPDAPVSLPKLTKFHVNTFGSWLELLAAGIEASSVTDLIISPIESYFSPSRLPLFSRMVAPQAVKKLRSATVQILFTKGFSEFNLCIENGSSTHKLTAHFPVLGYVHFDRQLEKIARTCEAFVDKVALAEVLVVEDRTGFSAEESLEHLWRVLLTPFHAVKDLVIGADLSISGMAGSLCSSGSGGDDEVALLPALRTVTIDGIQPSLCPGRIEAIVNSFTPLLVERVLSHHPVKSNVDQVEVVEMTAGAWLGVCVRY